MNEIYYMGLVNNNDYLSQINYPECTFQRANKTTFVNENEGFLKGNIEKDTYKPYKNYQVGNINVNNEKDRLMTEIQMYGFYLTDLGLYLDTHPSDINALKLFNSTRDEYYKKVNAFDKMYYPLNSFHSNKSDTYEWLEGKFPFSRGN